MAYLATSPAVQVVALVVFTCTIWVFVQLRNAKLSRGLLPPGPPGHWLTGTAIPKQHAHRKFEEWIKEYGPVISFRRGRELMVIIGRYDATVEIMEKEGGSVADRPSSIAAGDTLSGGMRTLLIGSGERLRKLRKALHAQLRPVIAAEYQPIQQINAQYFIVNLLNDPANHLIHAHGYAASVIISLTYGKPARTSSDDPIVEEVGSAQARLGAALVPGAYMVDAFPFLRYVPGYLSELRRQHQMELALFKSQLDDVREQMAANKDMRPCFAKKLLEHQEEYGLTDHETAYLAGSMFGAGSDTSAAAISIVIMAAAAFPEAQLKVQEQLDSIVGSGKLPTFQDEPDLVQVTAFYLETFRWRPVSAAGFAHRATKDIIWNGYVIPAGATVYGNHWSIARDPVVFPDPERFDPQRWVTPDGNAIREDLKVFQFGFGRRVCPGSHVANQSLFINTALLLWAFRIVEDKNKPIDTLAFTNTANVHPLPFSVRFEPRRDVKEMEQLLKET
ncbi:cytochrome P450 [Mycena albidolilacea]|uniref:Cytochrome P450 n=1 Tax=Mycena albidolilacea TaxID=1033008 RepID=A0AAD6ZRT8_9AGAR|nr:cytochrome P450 [Mycena albidolilacea]